ncbi:hypothetical protein DSY14_26600 [Nocardiopsis sp. MG754419]|nr:hypothetical protein [Nocardiopsis sp. MG754419]
MFLRAPTVSGPAFGRRRAAREPSVPRRDPGPPGPVTGASRALPAPERDHAFVRHRIGLAALV